ncbi:DUF2493 domain-containing protein [Nocardia cyriacigeorgica]|uniref:SLOG family protein n=1 Tax=Nocardia cyriacigeorgica TaxID=135487 RepID=UPI001895E989|nr:SLOG family protein [Nocardia cyriacigeorgica]MBF6085127.1 DUF2493 domain-containing protein [Nocardia cyriacigeorgica]
MARVLITGSRTWSDTAWLREMLGWVWVRQGRPADLELWHGGARGADRLGAAIWRRQGLPVRVITADWDKYGKRAGVVRNQQLVDQGGYAQAVAALVPEWITATTVRRSGTLDCTARIDRAGVPLVMLIDHRDGGRDQFCHALAHPDRRQLYEGRWANVHTLCQGTPWDVRSVATTADWVDCPDCRDRYQHSS